VNSAGQDAFYFERAATLELGGAACIAWGQHGTNGGHETDPITVHGTEEIQQQKARRPLTAAVPY
jgi:hypothetical protein